MYVNMYECMYLRACLDDVMYVLVNLFLYVCMCVCRTVEKEESIYHQLKFDLYFGDIAPVIIASAKIDYILTNCDDDKVYHSLS